MSGDRVTDILAFLGNQYDYIFVDAPKTLNPALNPATIAAIRAANYLLLITTVDLPSIRNLTRCLPLLKELGGDRPSDWIRVVANRYDSRGMISLSQVEETTGHPVFATIRNDYKVVMAAINEGTPAVMTGASDFAEDIRTLAGRITGIETAPKARGLGAWFRSFRTRNGRRSPKNEGMTGE